MSPGQAIAAACAADGTGLGRWLLRSGEYVLGTAADCDLRLDAAGLSRHHLRLKVLDDGGMLVEDLGSTNGSHLGQRRISRLAITQPTRLRVGSIQLQLLPDQADSEVLDLPDPSPHAAPRPAQVELAATDLLAPGWSLLRRTGHWLQQPDPASLSALLADWLELLPLAGLALQREGAIIAAAGQTGADVALLLDAGELGLRGWNEAGNGSEPTLPVRLREALQWSLQAVAATLPARTATAAPTPTRFNAALPGWPTAAPSMQRLLRLAGRVAAGQVPLLLRGPSGSGKEVLARWLHASSPRRDGPFVALNCAALPTELLEAEIFGIERGVATGVEARAGVFERAAGGSLFLDELGDMALATQAKLLRALEAREIYRLGGHRPVRIDVRLLSATHQDLEERIASGAFRLDLYHRVAAVELSLPALRERPEDIPLLATTFLADALAELGRRSPGISLTAMQRLLAHDWPGNVRELRHEMNRAALLLESHQPLDPEHLSGRLQAVDGNAHPLALEPRLQHAEAAAYRLALALGKGDHAAAMRLLGLPRSSYFRRLKSLREIGLMDPGSGEGEQHE